MCNTKVLHLAVSYTIVAASGRSAGAIVIRAVSPGGFQARGPVLLLWLNQETRGYGRKDSSDHSADASDR
jgi:hypothetical protein